MNKIIEYQTGILASRLDEAIERGFMKSSWVGPEICAYRGTDFPFNTCGPSGGRYHSAGETGHYFGSGEYCSLYECRNNVSNRVLCEISPHYLNCFDVWSFSKAYRYGTLFLQDEISGGYDPCRFLKDHLQSRHGVTGLLFQSYQLHKRGEVGLCYVIVPLPDQTLPMDAYRVI